MKPGAERGEDSTMSTKRPAGGWQFQRVTTHPGEMLVEEWIFYDHPSGYNRIHSAMVWKGENLDLYTSR